ncbi:MAG TPA: 4a-hydroxytetrahydrobiopterin dehydratase [Myxococcota bacterium]|jgi:4a-hydroxytetrahydrobiopterin dehydratase|nr:4a-hydroxytetrahydrobiopterin dehydratase [Myxococcota bacterium]
MARPTRLDEDSVADALRALPHWALVGGKLHRELHFHDFAEAFGFMARVALVAERMNHHPDWSNAWNRVVIDLVTHAAGGVTELDLALARAIDGFVGA